MKFVVLNFFIIVLVLLVLLFIVRCGTHNYTDPFEPFYSNHEVTLDDEWVVDPDSLTIISYNIKKSAKIDEALDVMSADENLNGADIIFLQEMDAEGTVKIAEALGYYYVYFPSSRDNKDWGNSILSKGRLINPRKVILPHNQLGSKRSRAATAAQVIWHGRVINLYSAHMSTFVMTTAKRLDQIDTLASDIKRNASEADATIVAGDFNTFFSDYKNNVISKMKEVDLDLITAGVGETHKSKAPLIIKEIDMVFSNNLRPLEFGKVADSSASDHYPIWVRYVIN